MYKTHLLHSGLCFVMDYYTLSIWPAVQHKTDNDSALLRLIFLLCFAPRFPPLLCIQTHFPLCLQATVLSMLNVSLLLNTQSPVSSQSLTRHFIRSARRNCWRSSTRVNTPLSSCGTRPSTRCRGTTSPSSRRWYPPTTCVWGAWAEVRGHTLDMRSTVEI